MDDTISAVPGKWRFDKNVSKAFDSHVRKSVPFYDEIQRMVIELSEYFVQDHCVVYDLGSSTGTTLDLLSSAHAGKEDAQFIGFDLSKFMIKEARKKVNRPNVRFYHKHHGYRILPAGAFYDEFVHDAVLDPGGAQNAAYAHQ